MQQPVLMITPIRLHHKEQSEEFMNAWTAVSDVLRLEDGFVKSELRRDQSGASGFDFVSFIWWQDEGRCHTAIKKHAEAVGKIGEFSRYGAQFGMFHWVDGSGDCDSEFDGMS